MDHHGRRDAALSTLCWLPSGYFDCTSGDLLVKGVAADPETLREFLGRAGIMKATTSTFQARAEAVDIGYNHEAFGAASDFGSVVEQRLAAPSGWLIAELERIRDCLPRTQEEIARFLDERAKLLNAVAPQVDMPRVFDSGGGEDRYAVADNPLRGFAAWVDWIDPALIISTSDQTWNDVRRTPRRDSVLHIAQALALTDSTQPLSAWITEMFRAPDCVRLRRFEGPAGPIYSVGPGTHRVHALRLLEVPAMLALVLPSSLPGPVTTVPQRGLSAQGVAALWSALRERGIVDLELCADHWHFRATPGEWMLASPKVATAVNRAYAQLYPGALEKMTGMSLLELTDPDEWVRALIGR